MFGGYVIGVLWSSVQVRRVGSCALGTLRRVDQVIFFFCCDSWISFHLE